MLKLLLANLMLKAKTDLLMTPLIYSYICLVIHEGRRFHVQITLGCLIFKAKLDLSETLLLHNTLGISFTTLRYYPFRKGKIRHSSIFIFYSN